MAITQHIDLNLIPNSAPVVVHVDQYDHGTGRIIASLYEDSTPYTPSAASVYVQGTKPDGKFFVSSDGVTLEGNVVTADLTEVMTQVAGQVRVQFVVTEQTGRTGTFVFWIDVQASALPDNSQMSESDISMVEEAIETMQEYVSDAAESAQESAASATASSESAEDSEAWAVGTRNGAPVPPTDPTYHNNSKYWAEHGGGAGGGHTIVDSEGNDMPQRGSLQFKGMVVTDDPTHDMTVVEGGAGGSVIKVHTSEASLHGEDVTLSDGTDTLTATFDSNGDATFGNVMMTGTLTLSSTDGTDTATGTLAVPYYGHYNIDISFWSATIQISTSTSIFNGLTVSAKKDGVVYGTGTFMNGSATINVPEEGIYTLECTYDWKTYQSDPVVVSAETTYSVTFNGFAETVNVIGEAAFANMNITISCSGMPTQTKQLDANAELTYLALQPGTYTFTINYQGTPYSVQQVVTTGGPFTVNLSRWTATLQFSTSSAAMDGQTIYVSLGGTVVGSATFSNGSASLDVHSAGTYEVSCTVSGFPYTKEVVVSQETTYNVTLNTFDATVNISTSSSQLYGASIQIKKGGVNYATTSFDNTGSATYVLHETGTYSFECTYGGQTYSSDDVVVSAETTYTASITMGLDLSAWITAGSTTDYPLNPSSYADFSALEADEAAVRQLMTVHDAVDYLAQASAGDSLMQSVINSNVCAKWINLNDYALDTLYANSDIADVMDTADKYGYGEWVKLSDSPETWGPKGNVPVMTADNAPYGNAIGTAGYSSYARWKAFDGDDTTSGSDWELNAFSAGCYLGYDFVNPICPRMVKVGVRKGSPSYIKETVWEVKGSNDGGSTWESIDSFTTQANTDADQYGIIRCNAYYKQVAVFPQSANWGTTMLIQTLQFYGRELTPLVPTMTGNTAPKGEVVASSASSSGSGFPAWKAFDGDTTTSADFWAEADAQAPNASWCGYKPVGTDFKCAMFGINAAYITRTSSITLQGSDDGFVTTPDDIKTVTKDTDYSTNNTLYVFPLDTPVKKGAFRLYFNKVSGLASGQTTNVRLIQFYGFDYSEKEFAQGSTRKTIYDHGVKPSGAITGGTDDGNNLTLSAVGTATVTIDKGTRAYMGGKAGLHASGTNRLKCGSGYSAFTASNMPDSNGFDISSISGSVAVGIEQTASGTFDCTEIWIE